MKPFLIPFLLFGLILASCSTVSDNIVSTIDQEQYNKLSNVYKFILDYRFHNDRESLDLALRDLDAINLDTVYNLDYKAKIIGLQSLTLFYMNNKPKAKILLGDLEQITGDEELFWIVTALFEEDKSSRLNILLEGREKVYSIDRLNSYLAEAYMENEMYGESTALYDSILMSETDFADEYRALREVSYLFMENPPSSYEYGTIVIKDQIDVEDLVSVINMETEFLAGFNQADIWSALVDKRFFHNDVLEIEKSLLRKDLAYFLFALIADRRNNQNLWNLYEQYYIPDLSDEMKEQLEGMSPITDIPSYKYYFYPVLYLVEEEIMELPDGEHFFPNQLVSGIQLLNVISSLENRLD